MLEKRKGGARLTSRLAIARAWQWPARGGAAVPASLRLGAKRQTHGRRAWWPDIGAARPVRWRWQAGAVTRLRSDADGARNEGEKGWGMCVLTGV